MPVSPGADRSGDRNDRTSCLTELALCPWHAGPDRRDQAPGQAGTRSRSASDPESVVDQESTRLRSGALGCSACSARSTTRSMFCLVLPGLTLTAGFPELRQLSRTTLGFRPPPDYGSGGWGFESLAARSIATGMLVDVQWEIGSRPVWATASTAWTTAATTSRQRGLDDPRRSKTGTGAAGSRATR
jgi:hypothetical protein